MQAAEAAEAAEATQAAEAAEEPNDPHATNRSAADQPVAEKPVSEKSVSDKPVSEKPMTDSPVTESLEIERKYEVGADAQFPDEAAFAAAGFTPGASETVHMVAEYFDTSDALLARAHMAMRKRQGGTDEGWHLKEKGSAGTRELHWALSDSIPDGLARELRDRIGEAADRLRPIATLRTERRILRLLKEAGADDVFCVAGAADAAGVAGAAPTLDARGAVLVKLIEVVEVVDDLVHAVELRADGSRVDRAWREWEAELGPGADPGCLDEAEGVLMKAGATVSLSSAKIARATGRLVEAAQARGASPALVERLQAMDSIDRETARKLTS